MKDKIKNYTTKREKLYQMARCFFKKTRNISSKWCAYYSKAKAYVWDLEKRYLDMYFV